MTTLIAPHWADLTKLAHEASSLGLGIDFDPTRIDTLTIKTGDETRGANFTLENGRLVEIRSINGAMHDAKTVDWVDQYTIDYDSRAQEVRSVKRIGAYVTETGQIDSKITKYVVIEPISKQGQIRLHLLTEQFIPRQDNEPNSVQSIHTTPIPDGWKPRFDNQDGGTIEN